jgi:hypothetical protein
MDSDCRIHRNDFERMHENSIPMKQLDEHVESFFALALSGAATEENSEVSTRYSAISDRPLFEFAEIECSSSIVGSILLRSLGKSCTPEHWIKAVDQIEAKLHLYLEQLDRVAAALAKQGVPLVALKNSGIARAIHQNLAECPMGDVDVLVRPADFRRAHEIMLALGFVLDDRSPFNVEGFEEAEKHGGAEYRYTLSDGSTLWFELQWRPVAGRWIQPDQEPSADELMARSIPIGGTAARLLSPEDNLLQVSLHTAKHSYVRAPGFRLHTDVDRITRACWIDWNLFCERVEQIGVRTAVYLSLFIPAVLLNSPVPVKVLDRLNHSPLKHKLLLKWIQKVGLFRPHDRKWSRPGYILFNLLLYDTVGGVLRGIFPSSKWMTDHYDIRCKWTLPAWYLVRMVQLVLRRAKT